MIGPIVEQPCYNVLERTKVEGEFQRLYTRCGIGLTTFSPLKMGMLSGKYEGAKTLPSGSRFAESEDKFAVFMKGQVGSEDWNATVERVTKLKVRCLPCCPSFDPIFPGWPRVRIRN